MARSRIEKLLPSRAAFSVLCLLAIASYHLWLREDIERQLVILIVLLMLTGLPHGAVDPAIARRAGLWRGAAGLLKFSAAYLGLAILMVAIWFALPELFFIAMLGFSVWHFAGDWSANFSKSASLSISTAIITWPALFSAKEVSTIFSLLVPASSEALVAAMVPISILSTIYFVFHCIRMARWKFAIHAELAILLVAAITLPPIPYFTVYFCLLHSPLHLNKSLNRLGMKETLVYAIPFTALSVLAGGFFLVSLPPAAITIQFIQVIFIGLFALTVPHMVLIELTKEEHRRGS